MIMIIVDILLFCSLFLLANDSLKTAATVLSTVVTQHSLVSLGQYICRYDLRQNIMMLAFFQ